MATAITKQTAQLIESIFALVEKFIAYSQVSKSSVKSYRKGLRRLIEYFAEKSISSPTRADVLEYREYLSSKYSPATANLYLTSAKLFFNFLQVEGVVATNPADHVKGLKIVAGHKKDALSTEQVKKILINFDTSTLKGKRDKAMFALMITAGLRTIEVSRANVCDIIERDGKFFLLVQGKGRNEKDSTVRIADGVVSLINAYLDNRADLKDNAPLFASCSNRNFGCRLTTTSISRIVKNSMKAAGFNSKRLTAHSLRHTAATTALKAGATLREVQQVLRHSSINVTTIYLHELDRLNNQAECLTASAFGI